jgi:hypothetical protein
MNPATRNRPATDAILVRLIRYVCTSEHALPILTRRVAVFPAELRVGQVLTPKLAAYRVALGDPPPAIKIFWEPISGCRRHPKALGYGKLVVTITPLAAVKFPQNTHTT